MGNYLLKKYQNSFPKFDPTEEYSTSLMEFIVSLDELHIMAKLKQIGSLRYDHIALDIIRDLFFEFREVL